MEVLYHLDEVAGSTIAKDSSGNSVNAAIGGSGTLIFGVPGRFNTGLFVNAAGLYSNIASLSGDYTISTWLNPVDATEYGTAAVSETYSVNGFRFGVRNQAPGFWTVESGGGIDISGPNIPTGVWSHVAVTVHPTGTFDTNSVPQASATLYVNGVFVASATGGYVPHPTGVSIGYGAGADFDGGIDEFAIWTRVLTDGTGGTANEILELYRRGANRLKYQIRTCADSTCTSGTPQWQGPENTNQTYFSELYNTVSNLITGAVQSSLPNILFTNFTSSLLSVANQEFFQYRVILESDDSGTSCKYGAGGVASPCSPELRSVTVGPTHYDHSGTSISNTTGMAYSSLRSFSETANCAGGVVYNLSNDNATWYYWNGSAWAIASGSSTQANSAVDVNSHIASFATQVGRGALYFKAFLQSSGSATCQLSGVTLQGTP